ncbi:MAG TPA: organic hydroperoxide resistance protein [Acidimicrobiales bacterium]|jgi:osmotically inducible protein OsmC|nr:organic hydroperoxide resistance protein [Acidimicrobiales bacterium]
MSTDAVTALYTAVAHATGDGRNGHVRTDDGRLDVEVRVPEELGGPGGATNPEQLFAAGYAACFHSALKFAALGDRLDIGDSEVSASVGIGVLPSGGFGLTVELDVHLPSLEPSVARAVIERAHATCPYSNATRGNIDVTLTLVA